VDGGLAFTTSPANGVRDVRLGEGEFVAAYLSRADHAPHRAACGEGEVWRGSARCLAQSRPAPMGRAVATHDKDAEGLATP
jgi:hypothetical protein